MERIHYLQKIEEMFDINPICGLLGARQVGKTTLAKEYIEKHFANNAVRFDLEDDTHLARLKNPKFTFENTSEKLIIIDEIQRKPELFPTLRVLVDENKSKHRFLILGSASQKLIRQSSESLAGRIGYIELPPFSIKEVKESKKLWLRGGFPNAYLSPTEQKSYLWRRNYIRTLLENDIPKLGFNVPAEKLQRFWKMLVHYHGQIFNANEIGKSFGVSNHTVNSYLDILAGTFMIRVLQPWFENLKKRQIKSSKIYFRDSGILHTLLSLKTQNDLYEHPRLGSFWEGFALEEIIRTLDVFSEECYFWATQAGAELDLLTFKNKKRIGFEFKYTDAPKITKSMRIALEDLKLDKLYIVYPGKKVFPMEEKITAFGLDALASDVSVEEIFGLD